MKSKLLTAVALAAGPLLWASGASADLLVEYSVNGGATFSTICSAAAGTPCVGSATTANGLQITLQTAGSNSPGTPALSDLLSAALDVLNTNATGTTASVELLIGDTGFAIPIAPPTLTFESAIGGTVVVGDALNTLAYFSCIDQGNGQNVCPGTYTTPTLTPSVTSIGAFSASNSIPVSALVAPYSMTEELTLTLSGQSQLNYSASSRLTPVPEPASLTLLGSALVGLGWMGRRRRKLA